MAPNSEDPASAAALTGSGISSLGGSDVPENSPTSTKNQALLGGRDELVLLRESTWRVGDTAAIHLELALGCLQVADDDALAHDVGRTVNAVRALAKLTNEISTLRNGGQS